MCARPRTRRLGAPESQFADRGTGEGHAEEDVHIVPQDCLSETAQLPRASRHVEVAGGLGVYGVGQADDNQCQLHQVAIEAVN